MCGHLQTDGLPSDQEPSLKASVGYTQIARKISRPRTRAGVGFCVRQRMRSESFRTAAPELSA